MADDLDTDAPSGTGRFAALPPRVPLEDLVEETNRWGFGMVGT